jgi:hypothetical protein
MAYNKVFCVIKVYFLLVSLQAFSWGECKFFEECIHIDGQKTQLEIPVSYPKRKESLDSNSAEFILAYDTFEFNLNDSEEAIKIKAKEFCRKGESIICDVLIEKALERQSVMVQRLNGHKIENSNNNLISNDVNQFSETILPNDQIKLNIGGYCTKVGWLNVNIQSSASFRGWMNCIGNVHLIRNMSNLHGIPNSSVEKIYSSHTLEHVPDKTLLMQTIQEWNRVLKQGGILYISVPDIKIIAKLLADDTLSAEDERDLIKLIYGGQKGLC